MPGLLHPGSDADFAKILKESGDRLVVVDFFATWCGPCRFIAPKFENLASEFPAAVFVKVDVDVLQRTAAQWGITAMPTIGYFIGGNKVDTVVGADWGKIYGTVKARYVVPAPPKKKVGPVTESREQLMARSVKELKGMMDERDISYAGLFEKGELVGRLLEGK